MQASRSAGAAKRGAEPREEPVRERGASPIVLTAEIQIPRIHRG